MAGLLFPRDTRVDLAGDGGIGLGAEDWMLIPLRLDNNIRAILANIKMDFSELKLGGRVESEILIRSNV